MIFPDAFVYEIFNGLLFVGCDRRKMGKVKPQPVMGHQGPGLFDMIAQHLPQRCVQNMGGGVVHRSFPAPVSSTFKRRCSLCGTAPGSRYRGGCTDRTDQTRFV